MINCKDCWHEPFWIESNSGEIIRNKKCAITQEQYDMYYTKLTK